MIRVLGGMVGVAGQGRSAGRAASSRRSTAMRAATSGWPSRPRVYFEEWDDPLISGIRWVEELVEIAGGDAGVSSTSARPGSPRIGSSRAEQVMAAAPDVIIGVVVRQAGASREDQRAARLGCDSRRAARRDLRGQVDLHPSARSGGADGRRAAHSHASCRRGPAPAPRSVAVPRLRNRTWRHWTGSLACRGDAGMITWSTQTEPACHSRPAFEERL